MGEKNLLGWTDRQAEWRRDALRRHAQSTSFKIDEINKKAIADCVKRAAGLPVEREVDKALLEAAHLNIERPKGPKALLVSLGPVENLARLAKGQTLSFAVDGLTIIYGDNASGKSGYCRIVKKLCRSQTVDDLLGDVFGDTVQPPAEVVVRYAHEGDERATETTWRDGTPPPASIKSISVFDSHNARFYIADQNRVEFLPAQISLLESHGAHCKEMQVEFAAQRKRLEQRLLMPLPSGFTPGGEVAQTLASLTLRISPLPSVEKLEELAAWTEEQAAELAALEKTLAQDPAASAARDNRCTAALRPYETLLRKIDGGLADTVRDDLKTKHHEAKVAGEVAAAAATEAFAGERLPGTGDGPWRQMFEHAKAYAVAAGIGGDVPSEAGDPCLLCQEPLSPVASTRLTRFNNYLAGATAQTQAKADEALEAACAILRTIAIPTTDSVTTALAEYEAIGAPQAALLAGIKTFIAAAVKRRDELVDAGATGMFDQISALPASLFDAVSAEIARIESSANGFRDQARLDSQRTQAITRQNALKDRKLLHNILGTVLARQADLDRHAKLSKCEELVDTQQLSTFITNYRRQLFTDGLQERIQAEISELDLGHIPFAVIDRSRDGQSEFKVGMRTKQPIANYKVLSEGEQRALALACFLAEAGGDEVQHGMVIDDPVSSLDHLRIRRVAKRLVEEAGKGRQLIVFTHNLLFYNEVLREAGAATPQVKIARRVISKSAVSGFGIVSEEGEPWSARKVTTRISDLQGRRAAIEAKHIDFSGEDYRGVAKDFYTDLRETWERLVETLLLGKVVERYSSEVMTQSLKMVQVEDDDYRTIFHAMKKVSERSGHDLAAAKQIPMPTPADMKADLEVIDTYRTRLANRAKVTEGRRRAMEGPPQATVMF
jgi:energy-coupling factor transporter ATP-binding protein EcfA2